MEEQQQAVQQEVEQKPTEKTYSQSEFDSLLQSEVDRRIGKARTKWEKEFAEKLEAERAEADKLSKLNADERASYERAKAEEEFQAERAKFEEERKAFNMAKLEMELVKTLEAEKLPTQFSQFLLADNAEDVHSNVQAFKEMYVKAVQEAVEAQVQDALRGKEPSRNVDAKSLTKQEFLKLPYKERSKMLKENPDFVHELLNS